MDSSRHIAFWIIVTLCGLLLTPLLRDHKSMDAYIHEEQRMTRDVFGHTVGDWIEDRANAVLAKIPSWHVKANKIGAEGIERTRQVTAGPGVAVVSAFNLYIDGLVRNIYVFVHRMFLVLIWAAVLAPVFFAAVVDGLSQRSIKQVEFGSIRPAAFVASSTLVIPLLMGPIVYLVVPFPVSPLIAPVWALMTALPLAWMVSNMQPLFGRR